MAGQAGAPTQQATSGGGKGGGTVGTPNAGGTTGLWTGNPINAQPAVDYSTPRLGGGLAVDRTGNPINAQPTVNVATPGTGGGLAVDMQKATPQDFYDSRGNSLVGNFADNISQHIVGNTVLEGDRLAAADINGDGKVNISDTIGYLRRDTGLEDWGEGKGADYYNQYYQQGDRYVLNPNAGQKRGDKYIKYEEPKNVAVGGGTAPSGNKVPALGATPMPFVGQPPTQGGNGKVMPPSLNKIVPGGGNKVPALGATPMPVGQTPTQGGKGGGNVQPAPQPTPYAGRPAKQNINTQSAQGITSAMQGTQQEMGYQPQQVRVPGTSATIGGVNQSARIGDPGQSGTIGGVNQSARIGDPGRSGLVGDVAKSGTIGDVAKSGRVGGVGQSAQVAAGQLAGTNFDPYMNPYTDAVIKSTEDDILRGGQKALTGLGSQASSAGAFGGSRHGIAMGEVGRNITEQMAKSATGLRQANFQQAQQAAQQDIASRMQAGLANQRASQFDIGNIRQQQLANQAASQFDIGRTREKQLANQRAGQFDIANTRQQQLANQQASQFDIGNRLKAGQLNQAASQFDIGNVRQQQLANQQAGQFDIGNRLKAGQLNQAASQFDIGNVRQAQLANQQAGMQDIQNLMRAQQLNQSAGLQGSANRLSAAQQLGGLANLGFGMGQTVQSNLASQGTQQQAMMQALIDAAKGQYGGYTGHPQAGLGYVTQALGATGTPSSTTKSKDPGLFDYLTLGASIPGFFPSDERLKKNITKMGKLKSGLNIYKWDWKEGAEKFGADMNHTIGVIAQEVKELFPNAVVKMDNGYYAVKYSELK